MKERKKKFGCLRTVIMFVVLVNLVNLLMDWIDSSNGSSESPDVDCSELMLDDRSTGERAHRRHWSFSERHEAHCQVYSTFDEMTVQAEQRRNNMDISYKERNFWGALYEELIDQTQRELDFLADSLKNRSEQLGYSRLDMARLTVSFIQDIPYSYVLPGACTPEETHGTPCLGHRDYGIISPYEFMHTEQGDCDTRSVLLYLLLEKMGFDPMIVVSDEYAHAMIALNIAAQGDYLKFRGRKYYFWETTATGWPIGMLPPDTNNIKYWKVALVNES